MRIVFAGTPAAAVPSLRTLLGSRHQVIAVISRPDKPAGRGRALAASPVSALAREAGLVLHTPATARGPEFLDLITALAPDAAAVVAYGALLPRPVLDVPTHGWINLHFSLLPAWRGAAPVQAAIRHGDDITGASAFRLEAGLDTGPVFGTIAEPIRGADTTGTLLDRLSTAGARLLAATMDGIEDGAVVPVPQPADGVSVAGKVTVGDARIDWNLPALAIDRLVRSLTPEPGAWTELNGARVQLGPITLTNETGYSPGVLDVRKREVLVGTGSTAVRLGEIRAPGRRPAPAADWARGARLAPATRFDGGLWPAQHGAVRTPASAQGHR